jgi:hypothetical protein
MPPVTDDRFAVSGLMDRLQTDEKLDLLQQALDRDYRVFRYLVRHAAGLELSSLEDRLLVLDYKVMRLWYRVTLTAAPQKSRAALIQMATILDVLVRKMGQQAGLTVEA